MGEDMNIVSTSKGSAFFVDLGKVIQNEIKKEKKSILEKQNSGTTMFIPFCDSKSKQKRLSLGNKKDSNNRTFTKEDFNGVTRKLSETIYNGHNSTKDKLGRDIANQVCRKTERNFSRNVNTVLEHNEIIAPLLRANTSPAIKKIEHVKSSDIVNQFEKSQDELLKVINDYNNAENLNDKDSLHNGWSKGSTHLPKLPKWATGKNLSLDSTILCLYPFPQPNEEIPTDEKIDESIIEQHEDNVNTNNFKIEELFTTDLQQEKKYISAVLPSISRATSAKPLTVKASPKPKRKKVSAKKSAPVSTAARKQTPLKTKNTKSSHKMAKKKGKCKQSILIGEEINSACVEISDSKNKTTMSFNKTDHNTCIKTSNNQDKIVISSKKTDDNLYMETSDKNRNGTSSIKTDDSTHIKTSDSDNKNKSVICSYKKINEKQTLDSDKNLEELDSEKDELDSIFEFYETLHSRKKIGNQSPAKTLTNTSLDQTSEEINKNYHLLHPSHSNLDQLTKDKVDLHNASQNIPENVNIDYYFKHSPAMLVESMEKTLSIDDSIYEETILGSPNKKLMFFPQNNFLSKISEERSQASTIHSNIKQTSHNKNDSGTYESTMMYKVTKDKRRSRSCTKESESMSIDDKTFQEMSHLMFQPGIVRDISPSLQSGSIDESLFESSMSNGRPYLKSVLGNASCRSVYSSSSSHASTLTEQEVIEWQKGKVIDRGAFGIVYQGLTSKAQLIAVKEVQMGSSKHAARSYLSDFGTSILPRYDHSQRSDQNYKKLQDEIGILKGLQHRNIIKFIGTSLEDTVVYIFMEYIAGGSLAGLISSFGPLKESIYQRYTRQIMSAVFYIHSEGVIHRDIKGANILITVKGCIKLIDFGCAKELSLSVGSTVLLKSVKGTPYWMAPEVIQGTGCNHKSDIWSVGCTLMELATGKPPWSEYEPYAAMYAIAENSNEPPSLSEQHSLVARSFVASCLRRDMTKRPSAEELLVHPFIAV